SKAFTKLFVGYGLVAIAARCQDDERLDKKTNQKEAFYKLKRLHEWTNQTAISVRMWLEDNFRDQRMKELEGELLSIESLLFLNDEHLSPTTLVFFVGH
ncbi:hypothetical protein SDJN02_01150, partial [Cucurbita argyrosperma subsp. argyrosperma]